jgi:TrmH family RNA methyltransferase
MTRAPRSPRSSPRNVSSTSAGRQPESISARENHWLKRFRVALAGPPASGEITLGIEGVRLVEEALRSNIKVEAVLVSESGRKHLARIIPGIGRETRLLATSDALFANLAATETTQGVAAIVWPRRATLDDLFGGHNSAKAIAKVSNSTLIVVLVGVQDPGNVGTILRTAEAFGATGVAACRSNGIGTAHVFSPKVVRASAGAAFRLPVAEGISTATLQRQLRASGVRMLAATSSPSDSLVVTPWQADMSGAIAIFIGNEGAGLPLEVVQTADVRVRIPLATARGLESESVESLNAASAAAILLYEAASQRGGSASNWTNENMNIRRPAEFE